MTAHSFHHVAHYRQVACASQQSMATQEPGRKGQAPQLASCWAAICQLQAGTPVMVTPLRLPAASWPPSKSSSAQRTCRQCMSLCPRLCWGHAALVYHVQYCSQCLCTYWCSPTLLGLVPSITGRARVHKMRPLCPVLGTQTIWPPVTHLVPQHLPPPLHRLVQTHLPLAVAAWCRQVLWSPAPLTEVGGHWRALQLQQPHSRPPPGGAGRTGCSASGLGLQTRLPGLGLAERHL